MLIGEYFQNILLFDTVWYNIVGSLTFYNICDFDLEISFIESDTDA